MSETSRHVLYGDDDDEDERDHIEHSLEIDPRIPRNADVLLLAWKVADIASYAGVAPAPLASISTVITRSGIGEVDSNLYEVCRGPETIEVSTTFPVYITPNLVIVVSPPLDESKSAYAGKYLIEKLTPSRLIVASPGQSFGGNSLCKLTTTASKAAVPKQLEAVPPVMVQGTAAAAVSAAERLQIPAEAFIAASDGPVGHEIVASADYRELKAHVLQTAGLSPSTKYLREVERDLSTLYV